jgi:hypothetical protein
MNKADYLRHVLLSVLAVASALQDSQDEFDSVGFDFLCDLADELGGAVEALNGAVKIALEEREGGTDDQRVG